MAVDREAAQRAIQAFLEALGQPVTSSPELQGTPARVVAAFADELLSGENVDVGALLLEAAVPVSGGSTDVAVTDIAVATVCPHHLLPALGRASVAYRPGPHVFGIGSVARLVDAFARRLTLQESIGERVVETLCTVGGARGAACRLELLHTCLAARGARQGEARVISVARSGEHLDESLLTRSGAGP